MYDLIVRERKILAAAGSLFSLTCLALMIFIVRDGVKKQNTAQIVIGGIVFGALMLLGIVMLMSYFLRRLCLGYHGCCYQTMFGRKREFMLRDIARVESKILLGDLLLIFYDSEGKKLAQVESNMVNAGEILPFLERYRLPALKRDIFGKYTESWKRIKATYDKHAGSRYYPERQREKRRQIEAEWSEKWIRRIRNCARLFNIIGVIVLFVAFAGSDRTEAFCFVVYPLAVWIFYLIFHRVLYWDIKTIDPDMKKQYVAVPYLPMILLSLCGIIRIGSINIEETWRAVVFGVLLVFVLLCSLRLIRTGCGYAELAIPVFIILLYGFISVYYWNCAFVVGEPEYVRAEIIEERKSEGTKSNSYYFTLQTKEGNEIEASVSGSMYHEMDIGDRVWICRKKSVFGIHFYYVGTG